jgi:small subunit ribosomal protein S18
MTRTPAPPTNRRNKRPQKECPFKAAGWKGVDYKDVETLKRFITDKGKILPRRVTGVSACFQRHITNAVKRARYIGLLPFVSED